MVIVHRRLLQLTRSTKSWRQLGQRRPSCLIGRLPVTGQSLSRRYDLKNGICFQQKLDKIDIKNIV